MKKSIRKVLSFALVVVLIFSLFTAPAIAEGNNRELSNEGDIVTIFSNSGMITPDSETKFSEDDGFYANSGEEATANNTYGEQPPVISGAGIGSNDEQEIRSFTFTAEQPVQSVRMSKSTTTLRVGTFETLEAIIEPSEADNKTVFWHSDNENVATVNNAGEVSAISTGNAIITAITEDGGFTASCWVVVVDIPNPPENVTAIPGDGNVILNWTAPSNHGSAFIYYRISVNNGEIWHDTAPNVTTYTCEGLENGKDYSFSIRAINEVGESESSAPIIAAPVGIFTIYGKNFYDTLTYDDRLKYVTTSGGGEGEVTYVSDNESVLSVDADGLLTIHKTGTATITAYKWNEHIPTETSASLFIIVNKKPVNAFYALLNPKFYDGTKTGKVTSVAIDGLVDDLTLDVDYYTTVEYDNENAGSNRTVTISVYLNPTDKANNYDLGANNIIQLTDQTIEKAPGGAVSVPSLLNTPTETSITITPSNNEDGTGQPIEYAISQESGVTPVYGWQVGTTFYDLTPDTAYYVYARTQENENYHIGMVQQSAEIKTARTEAETYMVTFNPTNGGQLTATVDGIEIFSGAFVEKGETVIFSATPNLGFKLSSWLDNSTSVNELNSTYTIDNIEDSHYVVARFEYQMYKITVNSEGENNYGSGFSAFENWVHIGAGETSANRRFSHWETSSDGVIFGSPTASETYFPMPANDVTVTAVFEDIPPVVSSVTVDPDIADVQKGTSLVFNAEVHGEYNPGQAVIWEVFGGVSETTISSDGLLAVSINETAASLMIKATSITDSEKFGIATVNVTPIPATIISIEVMPATLNLQKGDSHAFVASVIGENDPLQSVEWSIVGGVLDTVITPDGILTISLNETATELTVKATSTADSEKYGVATVTVTPLLPIITGVEITPNAIDLSKGNSHTFAATVLGENEPPQSVEWSILGGVPETAIAPDGTLTVSIHETVAMLTVQATSTVDSDKFGVATVNVTPLPSTVTGVDVVPDNISLRKGDSYIFTATVIGENNPSQSIEWSVMGAIPDTVITPDGTLTVSINETAPTLTVKATSEADSDKFGIATVTVTPLPPTVMSVEIAPNTINLIKGGNHIFTAIVTGENDPPQSVDWSVIGGTTGTTITSGGELLIDSDETADTLTVVATSTLDTEKSGTAIVTVTKDTSTIPTISGVEIIPNAVTLNKGDMYSFSVTVTGENNPDKSVEWSVIGGNETTSIDDNGTLTIGINETADNLTVQATSIFDSSKQGYAAVTVIDAPPLLPTVTSVEITPTTIELKKGVSYTFSAVVIGENNPPQRVSWDILGGTAATTISSDGTLIISSNETATVLTVVATSDFDLSKSDIALVTIIEDTPIISNVEIIPSAVNVIKGGNHTFSATVTGANAPGQSVVWSVIGGNGFTNIDSNGMLSVDADETAKVLIVQAVSMVDSSKYGSATVNVTETPPLTPTVTGVEIAPAEISLNQGDNYEFTAAVIGTNNPSQDVIWSISGESDKSKITDDGTLIIGIDETADSLTVVATSAFDTSKSCAVVVTIIKAPTIIPTVSSIDVAPNSITLNRGDIFNFTVTVAGSNNPNQAVTWSVIGGGENTVIDSNGKLTIDPDETADSLTVQAVSEADNSKSGTATVTILQPQTPSTITSVEVVPNTITAEKGSQLRFVAIVTGHNDPPQSVTWSVSGGYIGTSIDENGVLMVSNSETANAITVTATSTYDASKFGTAVVNIPQTPPIANPETPTIKSNPQSVTAYVGDRITFSVSAIVTDGGLLSYQWYKNDINSNIGGALITGATGTTYNPPTGAVGVTYYYVVVTNTIAGAARNGSLSTVSNPAILTVRNYPSDSGGNSGGSNNNAGNGSNQDNSVNENMDSDIPKPTDHIVINGKPAYAEMNSDGILEVIYTTSGLMDYIDENGDCIVEILEQSHIYLSLPISALEKGILTIKTDFGVVIAPDTTLQTLRGLYGDYLRLMIEKGSFAISLVDVSGNEIAYNDPDNPFWVMLPYSLLEGQDSNSVVAVKIVSGNKIIIPLSNYKDGYITFPTASTGKFDVLCEPRTYTDTENHWAVDSISFMSARGLFSGTGEGRFSPDETMTRAMFLSVLARLSGADLSEYAASRFTDVPLDAWYAASVEWAASIGLVTGVGNGNFAPCDPITKEQMAVILNNFIRITGYELTPLLDTISFADSEYISAWAVDAVGNIHQAGIITGTANSMYAPQDVSSRAEAATVFVRFIEAINR